MKKIISNNVDKTLKLGAKIGKLLKGGSVVALSGEFGSGKTTLIKGIARGLGVKRTRYVNSPSFMIIKENKERQRKSEGFYNRLQVLLGDGKYTFIGHTGYD